MTRLSADLTSESDKNKMSSKGITKIVSSIAKGINRMIDQHREGSGEGKYDKRK